MMRVLLNLASPKKADLLYHNGRLKLVAVIISETFSYYARQLLSCNAVQFDFQ